MKYAFIVSVIVLLSQSVSAQSPSCAAQEVLNTCLSNEDTYLKTCIDQDYACLCKWHTAKLSCFDNCPQDLGRGSSQGLKDTFCSIAKTYNTTTSSSSSVAVSTVVSSTKLPSNTPTIVVPTNSIATNTTGAASTSMSATYGVGQSVLMLVAGVTTWFL
ncbi:uncharacterized protein EV154DRAFT_505568, partial [Mucor mucedo]|uniref:uncharacterized protein n=1 Tax=Mucor mucedo TaxID=29922 RepID=UPI00221F66DB